MYTKHNPFKDSVIVYEGKKPVMEFDGLFLETVMKDLKVTSHREAALKLGQMVRKALRKLDA